MADKLKEVPQWLRAVLLLVLLGLVAGGVWFYWDQERLLRQRVENNLADISQLKINQLADWRKERLHDATILAAGSFVVDTRNWLARPGKVGEARILNRFRAQGNYQEILLIDPTNQVRLSLSGRTNLLPPSMVETLSAVWTNREPIFSDLFALDSNGMEYVAVVMPLVDKGTNGPVGAVILATDVRHILDPGASIWSPHPVETLLVERQGDAVVYLNEPSYQTNAAGSVRIPLVQTNHISVKAVLGQRGVVEGADARGVPVLAAVQKVPDTSWILIVKTNLSEIFADWHSRARLILVLYVALIAIAGLSIVTVWQGNLKAHYLALQQSEAKLRRQLERMNLLHQITRAIGERQDLASIFQVVLGRVEEELPVDFSCVCLYDEPAKLLRLARIGAKSSATATELALTEQATIPIDENGLARCVHGQLVYEPDISRVPVPFPQRLARGGLCSLVLAPLQVERKVFGVLVAARRQPDSFSSGECEFLKQLSEHVALAAHQLQLHGALRQAYDDLRQTQQAVMQQERLSALGQMASGIAHDINNAISPVTLYTESLLEKEPLSERARNYLTTIKRAIEDVAATVARMREFYRRREPELNLVPVDLNQLVEQVVDLTRARWSDMPLQRGIVIKLKPELAADLPAIGGVESEIREALINLVFNAVDAMPEGGTLMLRTKAVGSVPNRRVQVEVADSGVGMDEDTRRRCLEPFFTTKGERGTGLGLAMVYGTVKRHGAEIEIESKPGKGTVMRLSFAVPAVSAQGASQPPKADTVPPRLRILVVDDDPLLLKSLRDTLEEDGHAVTAENGGEAGIKAFQAAQERKEAFSVVITDLGMPHVDGQKVAGAVKEMSPSTPVIMMTGWGQRLFGEQDAPPCVDRMLDKPPVLAQLREALACCCRR